MEIGKKSLSKVINIKDNKIICPNCKKKSNNQYEPFCSKNCSDLDLMKWLFDKSSIN